MGYKDPVKRKEYYEKNKEKEKEYAIKRFEDLNQHAVVSITARYISNQSKWDMWCNEIKRRATNHKNPYSKDFTNDIMFDMMIKGCFYCGDLATTIDRIDSKLVHTLGNCVASCHRCNISKGVSDTSTFIRKAYYRARGKYVDEDDDIWFVSERKPSICGYKKSAKKKGVSFELSKEDWDVFVSSDCEYCHRTPTTWFGIDRVEPKKGYVIGNIVTCCWDCNNDKSDDDVETTMKRNNKIADRMDDGSIAIGKCEKVTLYKGTQKSSKKVCIYGKVHVSKQSASRAIGKEDSYVGNCIRNGRYPDDIFEITEEFYEKYKDFGNITKIMFEHFYM